MQAAAEPFSSRLGSVSPGSLDMVQAWYMDESEEDPQLPHRAEPSRPVDLQQLSQLGVLYWKVKRRWGARP